MTFDYKGYGRIFVEKEEDIQKVKDKIKEIDDFEYEYLPDDLISVWEGDLNDLVYNWKFDEMDIDDLCERLQMDGVKVAWIVGYDGGILCYHNKISPCQAKLMYKAGFMKKHEILKEFGLDFLEVNYES